MIVKQFTDIATLIVIGTIIIAVVANKNTLGEVKQIGTQFNNALKTMKA